MRILLTNDDGYFAEGLQTLCRVLSRDHEVYVSAPLTQQSGTGHSMHSYDSVTVRPVEVAGAKAAWSVSGTPVDSTKLGMEKLVREPLDCVISGINRGSNLACDVYYSGTVGAATEGTIMGVPSIAASLHFKGEPTGYETAARIIAELLPKLVLNQSGGVLYNVNVPDIPYEDIKGIRAARLGERRYHNDLIEVKTADGASEYVLGGPAEELSHREDDDTVLIKQGYVTVTPITLERTALEKLAQTAEILK